jgi:hypothetical protein
MTFNDEKRQRGRPKLEVTMPPEWKTIIIDAGRQGKHITDFLITLGISWDGHFALLKRNNSYYEAVQEYLKLCEQYWYNMALTSMDKDGGQGFNSRLWSLIMRNKFSSRWSEATKVDVTTDGDKLTNTPVQIEVIRKTIDI